jgi:hypothetical protein
MSGKKADKQQLLVQQQQMAEALVGAGADAQGLAGSTFRVL